MKIEEFVNVYSNEYILTFHKEEVKEEKVALSKKISNFLFQPRYEVNSLKFKTVG